MSLEISTEAYKVKPLAGAQNYQQWKVVMKNILSVDGTLNVALGVEKRPSNAPTKPKSESDDATNRYKRRLQDFNDRVSKWDIKNAKACDRIKLACKDETLVEVKDISSAFEIWEKLKKFKLPDYTIVRTAQRQLSRASQSEHKSVYEYGAFIKKAAQECTNTGKEFDDWMLKNFFIQGLNKDLEAYVIFREQVAEDNGKILTLDELIKGLVEYETRMKDRI